MSGRLISICIFLVSWGCGPQYDLKKVDKLIIRPDDTDSTLVVTDKNLIQSFKKVLAGRSEKVDCSSQATISFVSGDKEQLKTGFSNNDQCVFLIVNKGVEKLGYRLTYRVGMFLSESIYEMKKSEANGKSR